VIGDLRVRVDGEAEMVPVELVVPHLLRRDDDLVLGFMTYAAGSRGQQVRAGVHHVRRRVVGLELWRSRWEIHYAVPNDAAIAGTLRFGGRKQLMRALTPGPSNGGQGLS
jgi:hypothetical protein